MTVGELIANLSVFPLDTEVADGKCPCEDLGVYLIEGKVYIKRGYEE